MNRIRVKVCGITKAEQVSELVSLGVDALGLIFYEKSPRNISIETAKEIRRRIPSFVSVVGVFVNHSVQEVNDISQEVGLNLVQLHGGQSAEFAEELILPYMNAIRVDSKQRIADEIVEHRGATAYLLDTFSKDSYGGTGHRINDELLPENLSNRYILAGGINPDNIDEIIAKKPYAIDINSGVELSPGDKNIQAVAEIMLKIKQIS